MKKFIITTLLVLLSVYLKGQFCSQTTLVNMGNITPTGVNQTVTGAASAKRYWTFNATAGCTYTLSTCTGPNSNDTYLRLYSGTNPLNAVLVASNDDNGPICTGNKASLVWVCPTTGAYSILVTNFSCANLSSSTNLVYRVVCSPPYNPCTTIPSINCGVLTNVSFANGTGAYNPPSVTCGFSTPGQERIFAFTPTVTGNYVIQQPTSFGYIDYFYKVASNGCNGTGWTCIDDITNGNIGNANVNIPLTVGVTYYIMLDPETTGGGAVSFSIVCPQPVIPPANDNCANAINIVSLPYTSPITSNNNSTDDVPTSTTSCGSMGSNLWYFVDGNGSNYTVTTCNASTNFDTEVRVYTGNCGALNSMVEVVCNDDDGTCPSGTLKSTATWCAEAGVRYYITVGYFAAGVGYGNFVLNVTSGAGCQILPIELLSFVGYNNKEYNVINWVTTSEKNNDYFTLQRSLDAFDWETIEIRKGAGTSHLQIYYEYKDYSYTKDSPNYYRLIQTDYDDTKTTSPIIVITSKSEKKCDVYQYYDLLGREIKIEDVVSGIYLRKCGDKIEKIIKN